MSIYGVMYWMIDQIATGVMKSIRFNTLLAGHTKFAPDRNFWNRYKTCKR